MNYGKVFYTGRGVRLVASLLILFWTAMFVTACGNGGSASESLPVNEYNFFSKDELSGFWGQPKSKAMETLDVIQDSDDFAVIKTPKLMHLQSSLIYGFDYNKRLDHIVYIFFDRSSEFSKYEESYDAIKSQLETVYGPATEHEITWTADAQTQKAYQYKLGEAVSKEMAVVRTLWNMDDSHIILTMKQEKNLPFYAGVTIQLSYNRNN